MRFLKCDDEILLSLLWSPFFIFPIWTNPSKAPLKLFKHLGASGPLKTPQSRTMSGSVSFFKTPSSQPLMPASITVPSSSTTAFKWEFLGIEHGVLPFSFCSLSSFASLVPSSSSSFSSSSPPPAHPSCCCCWCCHHGSMINTMRSYKPAQGDTKVPNLKQHPQIDACKLRPRCLKHLRLSL